MISKYALVIQVDALFGLQENDLQIHKMRVSLKKKKSQYFLKIEITKVGRREIAEITDFPSHV